METLAGGTVHIDSEECVGTHAGKQTWRHGCFLKETEMEEAVVFCRNQKLSLHRPREVSGMKKLHSCHCLGNELPGTLVNTQQNVTGRLNVCTAGHKSPTDKT